jgi:hypothetical protein
MTPKYDAASGIIAGELLKLLEIWVNFKYPLIGVRANAYMRVNGHIWSTNYKWISFGQY